MPFVLGPTSRGRLATVEAPLQRVVERAIQLTKVDFMVLEGARSQRRQYELYAQGRTVAELRRAGVPLDVLAQPGKQKVTWTLRSNHFPDPKTGLGKAVDLCPFPVDWNDTSKFNEISRAMEAAAKELGVDIVWGADWDDDGKPRERGESDSPHFELKRKK
jgi:peptidoglycan L-alanyl-D-glutamate endopeptidase CwlK